MVAMETSVVAEAVMSVHSVDSIPNRTYTFHMFHPGAASATNAIRNADYGLCWKRP